MLQEGKNNRQIADALGRSISSISREVKRNTADGQPYDPFIADVRYACVRKNSVRKRALLEQPEVLCYVEKKLKCFWSPEKIVKRHCKDEPNETMVSVSTIYRAVHDGLIPGCASRTHLRRRGIPYKPCRAKFNTIHPDHTIAELPIEAVNRQRIGDWEGDTICGKRGTGGLLSLIDRKSRYCVLRFVGDMSASTMEAAIVKALRHMPVHTLLLDNGSEFAHHRKISAALKRLIYFADPHSPWQRGSNESNNGRVRFFFPKGEDTRLLTPKVISRIQFLLNNCPLKCLDWLTPSEAFFGNFCT